jgi:hypothetical protein
VTGFTLLAFKSVVIADVSTSSSEEAATKAATATTSRSSRWPGSLSLNNDASSFSSFSSMWTTSQKSSPPRSDPSNFLPEDTFLPTTPGVYIHEKGKQREETKKEEKQENEKEEEEGRQEYKKDEEEDEEENEADRGVEMVQYVAVTPNPTLSSSRSTLAEESLSHHSSALSSDTGRLFEVAQLETAAAALVNQEARDLSAKYAETVGASSGDNAEPVGESNSGGSQSISGEEVQSSPTTRATELTKIFNSLFDSKKGLPRVPERRNGPSSAPPSPTLDPQSSSSMMVPSHFNDDSVDEDATLEVTSSPLRTQDLESVARFSLGASLDRPAAAAADDDDNNNNNNDDDDDDSEGGIKESGLGEKKVACVIAAKENAPRFRIPTQPKTTETAMSKHARKPSTTTTTTKASGAQSELPPTRWNGGLKKKKGGAASATASAQRASTPVQLDSRLPHPSQGTKTTDGSSSDDPALGPRRKVLSESRGNRTEFV